MGGGGNTFAGFGNHFTNDLVSLHNSTNGVYTTDAGTATEVNITGTPVAALGYTWTVTTRVTADSIQTTIAVP